MWSFVPCQSSNPLGSSRTLKMVQMRLYQINYFFTLTSGVTLSSWTACCTRVAWKLEKLDILCHEEKILPWLPLIPFSPCKPRWPAGPWRYHFFLNDTNWSTSLICIPTGPGRPCGPMDPENVKVALQTECVFKPALPFSQTGGFQIWLYQIIIFTLTSDVSLNSLTACCTRVTWKLEKLYILCHEEKTLPWLPLIPFSPCKPRWPAGPWRYHFFLNDTNWSTSLICIPTGPGRPCGPMDPENVKVALQTECVFKPALPFS